MTGSRATRIQVRAGGLIVAVGCLAVVVVAATGWVEVQDAVLLVGAVTGANLLLMILLVRQSVSAPDERARSVPAVGEGPGGARGPSEEIGRTQAGIEKFAALGRLSAGVAHEINNPLGGILTCLESMRGLEPGSERWEEYLTLARSGLERIGTIVRRLLSFSRQTAVEKYDLDLNHVLREVTTLSAFHHGHAEVEVIHEAGELPAVHGSSDLLNQLFLNLVLNALHAMSEGGTLRIRTWARDGEVLASCEDTGPGIPEEHLERVFEPFFTTKDVGVGTGLGLSVALGIVESHGGSIHVENRSEGGARFTVHLPAAGCGGSGSDGEEGDR